MHDLNAKRLLASLLLTVFGVGLLPAAGAQPARTARTPAPTPAAPATEYVDGIAAVVNRQVITNRQLEDEVRTIQAQLKRQDIAEPDHDTLRKQVLQRLILNTLEQQEADRLGIRMNEAQLQQAVVSIASRNNMSVEQLRKQIEASGVTWDDYLKGLAQEVRTDRLRQRAVDSMIHISEADVDAYLRNQARLRGQSGGQAGGQPQAGARQAPQEDVLGLAQILVAVPESASASRVDELRRKAQDILARLRGGADFAAVAAASSDAPDALNGGVLGVRPTDGWPDLFLQATRGLQPGQVSDIVQSGNGFHILQVLTRGEPSPQAAGQDTARAPQAPAELQGPMMVTQTHARHILIKTSKVVSDEQAEARLRQLLPRLANGEPFDDLAKRYSQDGSAPQGGDLGWLSPGETVPPFEQAMNALSPGQISDPVQSPFGWHLIQVIDRRTRDMENEYRRMQARQILFQRRADSAYEDWLNQLRGQAFIDNRLDPQPQRQRR